MRKIACVKQIAEVKLIDDAAVAYRVDGWWVLDAPNLYSVGDLVVYCEIDSLVPLLLVTGKFAPKQLKTVDGTKYIRLHTLQVKDHISQGMLISIKLALEKTSTQINPDQLQVDTDVSEILGVKKFEETLPVKLNGKPKSQFPPFIEQTFQMRLQTIEKKLEGWNKKNLKWQMEEKLNGLSATFYIKEGVFGFCNRNMELSTTHNNIFSQMAKYNRIEEKLAQYFKDAQPGKLLGKNIAIQGEIIGEDVNNNYYNQHGNRFYVFDIFDIDSKKYWLPSQRNVFCKKYDFYQVPILEINKDLRNISTDEILKYADGSSVIADVLGNSPLREGLIFKSMVGYESFKVISNKFLLQQGE